MDHERFVPYYLNQAGNGLPGFAGAPMVYGRGLGSMLSKAFRFVMPFLKRGVDIAKPHLKTAAKSIASDVVSTVTKRMMRGSDQQEGSGILQLTRRKRKIEALPITTYKRKKRSRSGLSSNRQKKGARRRRAALNTRKKQRSNKQHKGLDIF